MAKTLPHSTWSEYRTNIKQDAYNKNKSSSNKIRRHWFNLMLNNISNALSILHEVARNYTSRSLLHTYTANVTLLQNSGRYKLQNFHFNLDPPHQAR